MERSAVLRCFKFISPTHTRCTKLQVQYTHTQIISSLTQSKSWMKPVVDGFESVVMLVVMAHAVLTPYMTNFKMWWSLWCISASMSPGLTANFVLFWNLIHTYTAVPTPGLIIYITKCVIFWYMFCTILVVMLICNFFIMHYHVFLWSKFLKYVFLW